MKKLKTLLCILLTLGIALFICSPPNVVRANNHTLHTVTSFGFVDHHARVNVDFTGYEDTSLLRIDVRVERQGVLIFNEKIVSESYQAEGESYHNEFFYPIHEDGVYACSVTYTVTDGNTEDVISFGDTKAYQLSEYTEHTHVWNHEVIEPTCVGEGSDFKFCYCGQSETTLLPLLAHTPGLPDAQNATYCQNCSALLSTGSTLSALLGQSVVLPSKPSGTPSYIQTNFTTQCSCAACRLERALPDTQPTLPKRPTLPTVDPWKKQQEAYAKRYKSLNCYYAQ